MRPKSFIPVLLSFLFLLIYCEQNNNPTQPKEPLQPGARNYVWQLDTLDMPMNYISSIWGASPDNVWAVGGGGTEHDRLLHYDGKEWSTYKKEAIQCGGNALFGFSTDNVLMGGDAGGFAHGAGIWHYNGVEWKQDYVYDIEGSHSITVDDIWGTAPNDIFACGTIGYWDGDISLFRGFVLHFDGKVWREVVRAHFNSQFLRIRKEQNKIYVFSYGIGYKGSGSDIEFYEIRGNELVKIYSNKETQIHWANLNFVDSNVYFVISQDIYRYLSGKMIKQFSVPYPKFDWSIAGRNELDLFFPTRDGIVHYNGSDMEYLYRFPAARMGTMGEPLIFENDIFYCIWHTTGYPHNNLILHGKL